MDLFHKWKSGSPTLWFPSFLLNLDVVLWTKFVQFEQKHITIGHGFKKYTVGRFSYRARSCLCRRKNKLELFGVA